ncbi:hypothetical protein D082_04940 [Synechocystis sp. PCC 6714]|nr:hypothetical protein D082_04940 [Synechocystis sp. PCC 6714]
MGQSASPQPWVSGIGVAEPNSGEITAIVSLRANLKLPLDLSPGHLYKSNR